MEFGTLITPVEAAEHLADQGWIFVDCRFVLGQPLAGRAAYSERHLPGAVYADLDADLSGRIIPGRTGRHPLPTEHAFEATANRLGITADAQVIAYDSDSGAMAAARLWWLLKWAGHDGVAVLDGGLAAWIGAGLPTAGAAKSGALPGTTPATDPPAGTTPATDPPAGTTPAGTTPATAPPAGTTPAGTTPAGTTPAGTTPAGTAAASRPPFVARFRPWMVVDANDVLAATTTGRTCLVDSRAADRYRGENETIDPVAGHIPGAVSMPFAQNLAADGGFLPASEIAARISAATGAGDARPGRPHSDTIFYCGSGVTAAHGVLAHVHAGFGTPKLYAGSWSEWITDPARPVAVGNNGAT